MLKNKILELKLIAIKNKIICLTETYLSVENVKKAKIAIPNFQLIHKDREKKYKFWGSAFYENNTLNISKMNWFVSLALRITDSNDKVFNIMCIYRSPNLSNEE